MCRSFPSSNVPGLMLAAVGLAALLMGAPAAVREERAGAQPVTAASSGSLVPQNSLSGSAILTADRIKPGGSTSGTVTITNAGDLTGSFALTTSNLADTPGTPVALSRQLDLLVVDVTVGGPATTVYAGKLGEMPQRPLGTFGPGEFRTYRFEASFPEGGIPLSASTEDNAYQASTTSFQFDWTATAADSPAPAPKPDRIAPRLTLRGAKQRVIRRRWMIVKARCNESCTLGVTGRLSVGRLPKARLRSRRLTRAPALRWTRLHVRLPRKALAVVKRGLAAGRPVGATLRVSATDLAGNETARRFRVVLRK